jgi:hypothetical protein
MGVELLYGMHKLFQGRVCFQNCAYYVQALTGLFFAHFIKDTSSRGVTPSRPQ